MKATRKDPQPDGMTTPRPATNAGADALRYAWLESISQSRFGTERTNRISRELADLIVKAEREASEAALSQLATATAEIKTLRAAVPDAYYLRVATEVLAALTEKPQETLK
jgi:hypothetical protein